MHHQQQPPKPNFTLQFTSPLFPFPHLRTSPSTFLSSSAALPLAQMTTALPSGRRQGGADAPPAPPFLPSLPLTLQYDIEDDEQDTKERVLQRYFLQEWTLLQSLLSDIVSHNRVTNLNSIYNIRSIVDKYQEQGQLLEPFLETIITPLMRLVRLKSSELGSQNDDDLLTDIKLICIIIYSLVTVCGYKSVIKFFPHNVSDLEVCVLLLEKCNETTSCTSLRQESTGEMEAKCVVLLWLSILVLVPFDIWSVDSSVGEVSEGEMVPLVVTIMRFAKEYLGSAGPMRMIAGLVLSKLVTRPDMALAFSSFVEWTHEVLSSDTDEVVSHFRLLGAVEALAAIFKAGSRKVLVDVIATVWNDVSQLSKSGTAARSPLLRKYLMKLTQRIGLASLPHRTPTWRYVGRTSTLGENVSLDTSKMADRCSDVKNDFTNPEESPNCLEDEDMDVPDIVEEIIERLLSGLRDTDTVVRWSAAKGIGRITSRLTSTLSDEVLSSVLELFSPGEGDGSWHGGCLALAELARRGLLLPSSLLKVVPFVVKALHYDIRRGPHSVGSHVRDAAAYVCWAFGRAYYHTDMRNVLDQLTPNLLTVACYDREVNCRRAAAAAFQENVGRQGNYPNGIDIVNAADYFSLSSRVHSYLHVAVSVAHYEGYLYPFAEELLYNKTCHWDKGLRELAAEALSSLVKYDPDYFANFIMEKLVPSTLSTDLCMRHGATLAVGEVVLAMHQCGYTLATEKQKLVAGVVPAIEKARLYRGKGGEIMRSAVSRYIECISLSRLALSDRIKGSLLATLNENLRHPNSQIQNAAVKALQHFVQSYFAAADDRGVAGITLKYMEELTDKIVAVRRGSALALGALPYEFLSNNWKDVILKLCCACAFEDDPEDRDAEARVNAVKGLVSVCETLTNTKKRSNVCSQELELYHVIRNEVLTSLLKAIDDYSVDNRGDVGSWVREAAMEGLETCTYILCFADSTIESFKFQSTSEVPASNGSENNKMIPLFDENLATNVIGRIIKQAVEKMDKLREAAVKVLRRILYNKTIFVPFIPFREKLEAIVPNEADLKWGVPTFSYPRFVRLLHCACYSKVVLSGLVISIGGLQDSLKKASMSALLDYLRADEIQDPCQLKSREYMLGDDILWVLQQYKRCDRVIVPTLKAIEILFSKKILLNMEGRTWIFCVGVLDSLTIELKGSKEFSKLYAGIAILGYIASLSDPINNRAFGQLLSFLIHRYPKMRKACAEQVYLTLLQNGELVPEDKVEQALEIISETCWDGDVEAAKYQRSELCQIAGLELEPPKNGSSKIAVKKHDENASYSSLVGATGF